jgi:hypothetical protein
LHHAVGDYERVVVGQRNDAGAEADVFGAFGGGGDEDLGAGDDLEAAGVVLADPGLLIVQRVQVLEQFHIPFQGQNGVFRQAVERREEDAAAKVGHVGAPVVRWGDPG